jgi:hypothetical protein
MYCDVACDVACVVRMMCDVRCVFGVGSGDLVVHGGLMEPEQERKLHSELPFILNKT